MKIPWFIRIALWFRPMQVAVDIGMGKDKTAIIFYKELDGKVYVIREEFE